ncbi:hypothetical protein [Fusobacterium canifelinum]|uniref:Uncharacterized protein n=1 Tax=Fusobacterium canifelinum TaxID=285729 RepID=A0A3P1UTD4_9FUSO|nr:hypothetical protein [Fusobacterium canifelinum]QQB74909.1 hypothetical protein I6H56_05510 [Fusobacterium canifelinum]RRD25169.1 hypothetical protein EII27_06150 [Fusobacterium canifelinum]
MKIAFIYIGVMVIIGIIYSFFMYKYSNRKKKELIEWLEKNPKAAKIYIGKTNSNLISSMITPSSIQIISIDDSYPMTSFREGFKQGFYLVSGKHKITSSFTKSRPGIFYKTVSTTYGPTTQEVEVEGEKTYIYSFDKKNEQYTFTEVNQ